MRQLKINTISKTDLLALDDKIRRLSTQRDHAIRELKRKKLKLRAHRRFLQEDVEIARKLIQIAAQKTQENLQFHISNLVTSGLYSVFPNPYNFVVKFVQRRNNSECDMFFERKGNCMEPEFASGGGPLDVASFSSRISQLTLEGVRPIVVLDEPFKNLSRGLIKNACEMLKALKKELKIQFIIVTHVPELVKAGDKIFEVENGRISEWT